MSLSDEDGAGRFVVLVNNEEQHSLWPDGKGIPEGWRDTGILGSKEECLAYVDETWTDMRPLSLRRKMEGLAH